MAARINSTMDNHVSHDDIILIEKMITFLDGQMYVPYDCENNVHLQTRDKQTWPEFVCWSKTIEIHDSTL